MPRVLVVDDDILLIELLRDWLTELGCEIAGPAQSVDSALEVIAQEGRALDGAILDVSLGKGDSYPVAEALRARGIPFAFATGHGVSEVSPRFEGSLIVPKPFMFRELKTVVARMLDPSGSHQGA